MDTTEALLRWGVFIAAWGCASFLIFAMLRRTYRNIKRCGAKSEDATSEDDDENEE